MLGTSSHQSREADAVSVRHENGEWIVLVTTRLSRPSRHIFADKDFALSYARGQSIRLWVEGLDDENRPSFGVAT